MKKLSHILTKRKKVHLPNLEKTKVGIQLGENFIKIVEMKKEKKQWILQKSIVEQLPEGVISDGRVVQSELLGLKIKELFKENKIKTKKVSVFIEELPFFIRHIQLPKLNRKEQENALHYQAQLEIPVDIDKLTIRSTQNMIDKESDDVVTNHIIFATYNSLIKKSVEAIHAAGLHVNHFVLEPEAIFQGLIYHHNFQQINGCFMIVKMNTNKLLLSIYKDEKLIFSRYVPVTSNETEWEREIQRTIVSWNGKHKSSRIEKVVLLGDRDRWITVKGNLENFMPLTVELSTDPFTACIGVSLFSNHDTSLYTDTRSFNKNLSLTTSISILLSIIVFIGCIYLLIWPIMLQKEISQLQDKINSEREILERSAELDNLLEKQHELITIKESVEQNDMNIRSLLHSIQSYLPPNCQINEIAINHELIKISGESPSQKEMIQFLKGLQRDPEFPFVQLSQSYEETDRVQFSFDIFNPKKSEDASNEETN